MDSTPSCFVTLTLIGIDISTILYSDRDKVGDLFRMRYKNGAKLA